MVLQRNSDKTRLWGTTDSEVVNLRIRKGDKVIDDYEAKVNNKQWEVKLKSYPEGGPFDILVKTSNLVTYRDVMFGDVFLCSGQSNMEMAVSQVFNADVEMKDSVNYPYLRMFRVNHNDADSPRDNVQGEWKTSSPEALSGAWDNGFSAVCYFYGRNLYVALKGAVPIGLIETNWGGTRVETWMSEDARKVCNDTDISSSNDPNAASHMWNGQVVPLLKYNILGAIWYQGEANGGDQRSADRYRCSFPAMIQDWRAKWNVGDFPFYFVQISGWQPGANWGNFRLAQLEALKLPNTYFVSSLDIGHPTDIHPQNKQEVGRRLSLISLNQIYKTGVRYKGPEASSATQKNDTIVINLDNVTPGTRVQMFKTPECTECCTTYQKVFRINTARDKVSFQILQMLMETCWSSRNLI